MPELWREGGGRMSEKLKPCPFCGGEAEIKYSEWVDSNDPPDTHHVWSVGCAKRTTRSDFCLGRLCQNRGFKDRAEAIAAWNTRAERTCSGHLERIITLENLCRDLWDDTVQIHELEGYSTSEELEQRLESLGLLGVEHG